MEAPLAGEHRGRSGSPAAAPQLVCRLPGLPRDLPANGKCRAAGLPLALNWAGGPPQSRAAHPGDQAGLASGRGSWPSGAFLQVSRPPGPSAHLSGMGWAEGRSRREAPTGRTAALAPPPRQLPAWPSEPLRGRVPAGPLRPAPPVWARGPRGSRSAARAGRRRGRVGSRAPAPSSPAPSSPASQPHSSWGSARRPGPGGWRRVQGVPQGWPGRPALQVIRACAVAPTPPCPHPLACVRPGLGPGGLSARSRRRSGLRAAGRRCGSNSVLSLCSRCSKAMFSKSLDIVEAHPQFSKEDRYTPCPPAPAPQPSPLRQGNLPEAGGRAGSGPARLRPGGAGCRARPRGWETHRALPAPGPEGLQAGGLSALPCPCSGPEHPCPLGPQWEPQPEAAQLSRAHCRPPSWWQVV